MNKLNKKPAAMFKVEQNKKGDWWAPYGFVKATMGSTLKKLNLKMDDGSDEVVEVAQAFTDKAVEAGYIEVPKLGEGYRLTAVRNQRFGGKIGFVMSDGAGMGGASSLPFDLDD